ncbi:MAG: sulfatase-like hydrolase/transferase [Actinomycetota bacterium]
MPTRVREEGGYFLEILALTAFAFAQPLLDVFGRSPETFVFRDAGPRDIVLFAMVLCLVPPLVVGGCAAVANWFGRDARKLVQTVVVGALFGVLLLVVVKKVFNTRGALLVTVAVAGGIGFGALYHRADAIRLWLRYASVAPLAFALLFLFASPVSQLLSVGSGASADVASADTPVVVLVLDELPTSSFMRTDGTIDAELFPGFAELAGDATWYRDATGVALRTFYAVPAILTGRFPDNAVVPVASTYPANLFTLLGGSYDVHSGEALTRLCPARICGDAGQSGALGPLLGQASEVWTELSSPSGVESDPNESLVEEPAGGHATDRAEDDERFDFDIDVRNTTPARFEEFLAGIENGSDATLDFLDLILPHSPFQYYPSGVQYDDDGAPIGRGRGIEDTWTTDEGIVRLLRQRHLLQTQYVDTLVTRMLDRLRDQDLYDRALVIVTADHGVAFEPGESSRGGDKNAVQPSWPEMASVPLFVKAPNQQEGAVSDANVLSVDILPTVADYLGIDLPWDVDGRSVRGEPRRTADKVLYTSNAAGGSEQPGSRHEVDGVEGARYVRTRGVDTLRAAGDPQWALYRTGPFPELVGQPVAGLTVAAEPTGPVDVKQPERFESAAPTEGRVPGVVYGTLGDGVEPGAPVACAVNGTIAGVSPRFTDSRSDFGLLPPDFLWRDGQNDVSCFVVRAVAGGVELVPLRRS